MPSTMILIAQDAGDFGTLLFILIFFFFALIPTICLWVLFEKAGQPGWAAIIPFYNTLIMLRIGNRPEWWVLGMFIPFVNLYFAVSLIVGFVEAYDFPGLMAVGVVFLPWIFLPIMAGMAEETGSRRRQARPKPQRRRPERRRVFEDDDDRDAPRRRSPRSRGPEPRRRRRPQRDDYEDDDDY